MPKIKAITRETKKRLHMRVHGRALKNRALFGRMPKTKRGQRGV